MALLTHWFWTSCLWNCERIKVCFQPRVCGTLLQQSYKTSTPPLLSLPLLSASCTHAWWGSVLAKSHPSIPALTCGKTRQIRVTKSPKDLGCGREIPLFSLIQICHLLKLPQNFASLCSCVYLKIVIMWRLLPFSYNTLFHLCHLFTPYAG